jgi:transposase, IS5 family
MRPHAPAAAATLERAVCDRGYRGHKHPPGYKFKIFIQCQKQRMTPAIKRELKRRSAIDPSASLRR